MLVRHVRVALCVCLLSVLQPIECTTADDNKAFKTTTSMRDNGQPNPRFLKKHSLNSKSLPVEFADAFFPMYTNEGVDTNGDPHLSMESIARNANMRANMTFAGEARYENWSGLFSVKEIRQHLRLYVLNGLSPSPGIARKFDTSDRTNYNTFVSTNLGMNTSLRLRQFKCFMGIKYKIPWSLSLTEPHILSFKFCR